MKSRGIIVAGLFFLWLAMLSRAPAPIVEESPKPEATAKPRPKSVAQPKPTPRPTVKPEPAPTSYAGVWQTNFNNELHMTQTANHVTGLYDEGRGVLDGTVDGNALSGTWAWKNQKGIFNFSLSKDGRHFTGVFSGSGIGGPWTGIRKSP